MTRIKNIFVAIIVGMLCAEHAMASCYGLSASACYADSSCEWSWSRDICTDACSTRTSDSTCDSDSADGIIYCSWDSRIDTCVYLPCSDFASTFSSPYLEQACDSSPACKWDSGTSACVTDSSLGAVPDSVNCSDIHNSTDCTNTNNNRCTWIVGKDTQGNSTSDTACIDTPQGVTGDDCSVIGNYYFSSNPSLARGLCQTLSNICVMIQGNGSCKKKMSSCPAGQYLDGMYQCADCPSNFPYSANNNSGTSESCYQKCLEGTIGYNTTSNNSHDPAECNVNNRDPCNLLNCQFALIDGSTGQQTGEYTYRNIPTGCSSLGTTYCTTYNPANMLNYCLQFTTGTLAERQAFCNEYISDTESTSVKWGCYLNGNSCVSASQCSDITDSNLCANVTTLNCKWQNNQCVVDENCPTGQFIGPNDRCYTCDTMMNEFSCTNQTHGACMWAQPRNYSFETTGTASCIAKPTKTSGQTTSQFCATIKKANFNNDNELARGICYSLSECSWCGDCTAITQTCSAGNYLETNGETNKCCWDCDVNTHGWPYSPGGTGGQNTCYKNCGTGSATYPNQCVQCCDGTTADSLTNCPSCHSCTAVKVQDFCDGSNEVLPDCTWTNNKCEQWSNCNAYNSDFGQYAESWCSANTKCIWRNSTVGCTEKCEGITISSQCLPANGCTWVVGQDSNGANTSTTKCVTTSEIPSTCTNITSSTYGTEDIARSICNSQSSCVWNSESNGCKSAKTASNCSAGQYFDNRWCWSCPNEYPNSVAHSTGDRTSCYNTCSDSGVEIHAGATASSDTSTCPTQCTDLDTAHCTNPTTWGCYINGNKCASADRCGGETTESSCTDTRAYSTTNCEWDSTNNQCFSGSACYNITDKNVCNGVDRPGFGAGCRWDEEGEYCEQKHTDCAWVGSIFSYYLDEDNGQCFKCDALPGGYTFIDPYDEHHPNTDPGNCFDVCYDGTKKYASTSDTCPSHPACEGRSVTDVTYTNGNLVLNPCLYDDKCTIVEDSQNNKSCETKKTSCPAGEYLHNGWCYSCSDKTNGEYPESPDQNQEDIGSCYRTCCDPTEGIGGIDKKGRDGDTCKSCSSCSDINTTNFSTGTSDTCIRNNKLLLDGIYCRWKDDQCIPLDYNDECYLLSSRFGHTETECTNTQNCFWDASNTLQECFHFICEEDGTPQEKCRSDYGCTWVTGQNASGTDTSDTRCLTTISIPSTCSAITAAVYNNNENIARGLCNDNSLSCVWNSQTDGCVDAPISCSDNKYLENKWCWSCPSTYPNAPNNNTGDATSCYKQCYNKVPPDYNNNSDSDACFTPTKCTEITGAYCLNYVSETHPSTDNSVAWGCYLDNNCYSAESCYEITDSNICSKTSKFDCKWVPNGKYIDHTTGTVKCIERKTSCSAGEYLDDGECKKCNDDSNGAYITSPGGAGGYSSCYYPCCDGTIARPQSYYTDNNTTGATSCNSCSTCADRTTDDLPFGDTTLNPCSNDVGCTIDNGSCRDINKCSDITKSDKCTTFNASWNCILSGSTCRAPTKCSELTAANCTGFNTSWNCILDGSTCRAPTQCSELTATNCMTSRFSSMQCFSYETGNTTSCAQKPQNCSNDATCCALFLSNEDKCVSPNHGYDCVFDTHCMQAKDSCDANSYLVADRRMCFLCSDLPNYTDVYTQSDGGTSTADDCYRICNSTFYKYGERTTKPVANTCDCRTAATCETLDNNNDYRCKYKNNNCIGYCESGRYVDSIEDCASCSEHTDGKYPKSDSGPNTSINRCYSEFPVASDTNRASISTQGDCSTSGNGKWYYGCTVTVTCNIGFYYNSSNGKCTPCTEVANRYAWTTAGEADDAESCGFSCNSGYYPKNDEYKCEHCPDNWPNSDAPSTSQNSCYTTCADLIQKSGNQTVCEQKLTNPNQTIATFGNTCVYNNVEIKQSGWAATLPSYLAANGGWNITNDDICERCTNSIPNGASYTINNDKPYDYIAANCPWEVTCTNATFSRETNQCESCPTHYKLDPFTVKWDNGKRPWENGYTTTNDPDVYPGNYVYYDNNGNFMTRVYYQSDGSYCPNPESEIFCSPGSSAMEPQYCFDWELNHDWCLFNAQDSIAADQSPDCIPKTYDVEFSFNLLDEENDPNVNSTATENASVTYNDGWYDKDEGESNRQPITKIAVPQTSRTFLGYYTQQTTQAVTSSGSCNGQMVFDANGVPQSNTLVTATGTYLYACWGNSLSYTLKIKDSDGKLRYTKDRCAKTCTINLTNALNDDDQLRGHYKTENPSNGYDTYFTHDNDSIDEDYRKNSNEVFDSISLNSENKTITFVLSSYGIIGLNATEPDRNIIIQDIVAKCPEESFCDGLVQYPCLYNETTNQKNSTASTDCKYFKNQAEFKDKQNNKFKLPEVNQLIQTAPHMTGKAYKNKQ